MDTARNRSGLYRGAIAWSAAVAVPAGICAAIVLGLDGLLNIAGESALFFVGVLLVSLLGGIAPASFSALLSGLLLNYFLTDPRRTLRISDPDTAVTLVVMLLMAVAVAALVDNAATRQREARRAAREAELLTTFADAVLGGADLESLLSEVAMTLSRGASSRRWAARSRAHRASAVA